jgi:hypothetical protein
VSSASALKLLSPTRSVKRPAKVISGWFSTSKKWALRKCASRSGSPIQILVASMTPVKVVFRQSATSKSTRPWAACLAGLHLAARNLGGRRDPNLIEVGAGGSHRVARDATERAKGLAGPG